MKIRCSNIELLRIICMILVVAGHANYLVFGVHSKTDILYDPIMTSFRIVVYQLCVIAVNCFVFISGWFKIKPNIKKGAMLLFQSLEYGLGIALLFYLLGYSVPQFFLLDYSSLENISGL